MKIFYLIMFITSISFTQDARSMDVPPQPQVIEKSEKNGSSTSTNLTVWTLIKNKQDVSPFNNHIVAYKFTANSLSYGFIRSHIKNDGSMAYDLNKIVVEERGDTAYTFGLSKLKRLAIQLRLVTIDEKEWIKKELTAGKIHFSYQFFYESALAADL